MENFVSTDSVKVRWSHIPSIHLHGILAGYTVRYKVIALGLDDVLSHVSTVKTNPDTTSIILEDLKSFGKCQIEVSGFTSIGEGPAGVVYGGL